MFERKIKWKGNTLYYIVDSSTIIEILKITRNKYKQWIVMHSNRYQSGISIIFYDVLHEKTKEDLIMKIEEKLLIFASLTLKTFKKNGD